MFEPSLHSEWGTFLIAFPFLCVLSAGFLHLDVRLATPDLLSRPSESTTTGASSFATLTVAPGFRPNAKRNSQGSRERARSAVEGKLRSSSRIDPGFLHE
jgi:hypothetical protein